VSRVINISTRIAIVIQASTDMELSL